MTKDEALKMAIEFIEMHLTTNDRTFIERTATLQACKEALEQPAQEVKCNPHPNAPHGFMRDASHNSDRYVCECEFWEQPAQEPYAWEINHLSATSPPPYIVKHKPFYKNDSNTKVTPLYTHPAPSWQGLDAVEVSNIFISKEVNGDATQFARAIEQALKEKNNGNH